MTLAASIPKEIYDGNDSATNFSFSPHMFWQDSDLVVKHKSIGGTRTTLVLDTDYTVNGAGTTSGSVDFPKPGSVFDTLATGEQLMIKRVLIKQETPDLSGAYQFPTLNKSKDYHMAINQELLEMINRSLIYDDFNDTAPLTAEQVVARAEGILDGVFPFPLNGGGGVISTGTKYYAIIEAPYAGTIDSYTLVADQSGNIVLDIWKDIYLNFPPTVADSITAAAKPTLSAAQKSQDSTLTGWTKTFSKGDIFLINVDSISTITEAVLLLKITKSGS